MSTSTGKGHLYFDCIVERRRFAPFGGGFAIIVALLLLLIAIAAIFPARRSSLREAGAPAVVFAA